VAYVCRLLPLTCLTPDIVEADSRWAAAEGAQAGRVAGEWTAAVGGAAGELGIVGGRSGELTRAAPPDRGVLLGSAEPPHSLDVISPPICYSPAVSCLHRGSP
jgi:hypothetical protein